MKQLNGFPARMKFTPIPNFFLANLLSQIGDIIELKVTLHFFEMLYQKRGYPRFVTYEELLNNRSLIGSLGGVAVPLEKALRCALEAATNRGTLLHITLDSDGMVQDVYFLNNAANRRVMAQIESGELRLSGLKARRRIPLAVEEQPDIFNLYEENIGMLTPMIADELREAEKLYPVAWIRDAIKVAVSLNKRNWRYIAGILERWSIEGKSDGAYRRDSKKTDPDKYIKGRYGHMVKR